MLQLTDDYIANQLADVLSIPDVERSLYILQYWQKEGSNGSPISRLREYMVRPEGFAWIIENIIPKLGIAIISNDTKPEKRKDKYAKLMKLASDNLFHEFTTQQLVDASGLGAQTVTKWAKTTGHFRAHPDKRGVWEARDPKADRRSQS